MTSRGKAFLWAALPVLLIAPPQLWLGKRLENQLAYEQRTRTQNTLELHADAAQRAFARIEGQLESLATFVASQTDGGKAMGDEPFNTFAAGLHASSEWIQAFQTVTDGVITHTYPLKGNEAVLGYNLLADPRPVLGGDVIRALQTGRVTITGPLSLVQGGLGIIIRKPLSRTNDTPARLVAIVLNIAPLLAESGIGDKSTNEVQLAIRREAGEVFFGPPAVFEQRPVTRRLSLPDGSWEMGACPLEGWQSSLSQPVLLFHLTGAVMILLLCLLVFALARRQADLSETVQERTLALHNELAARQRAQEQLRQNYSLLQAVTDGTSDAVFVKDRGGCYQMINSAGARFLGSTPEAVVGKNDLELFSEETARAIMDGDRQVIESGQVRTFEERGTAAGITRVYQATKAPWRDEHSNVIGVVGVSRDITGRKATEAALLESETRYRFLFEHNPMPMLIYERDTLQMMAVNEAFLEHYGYSAQEALALHLTDLYPEEEKTKIAELIPRLQGHANLGEWRHRKRDGSFITIVASSHDLLYEGRNARVAVMTDITERKRVEEALRHNEEQSRLIMENLADLVAVLDLDGRRLYNSPSYQGILGDPARLRGSSSFDQVHPEDRARVQQAFLETVRTGVGQRLEYRMVGQDGRARYIESQGSVIRDAQGRVSQVVVVSRDVTERRQAEEAIRELNVTLERRVARRTAELAVAKERAESADRLKSAFLATMSHELRTPLNSIIGFTGIILQELAGPLNAEQTKQLGMVQSSARHLLALINDVLDISKIEAGQVEIRAEEFDLRASLEKASALVKPLAEKKGLALRLELPAAPVPVVSDRMRVEQVLLNLLNNAVKFTQQGEAALLAEVVPNFKFRKLRVLQPVVRLRVTDTGIGIKHEDLAKLFQPFRQVDSGLTRQHEGTGLGLAICRRLADLLGGEISVQSEWGKGSAFTFVFPVNATMSHEIQNPLD